MNIIKLFVRYSLKPEISRWYKNLQIITDPNFYKQPDSFINHFIIKALESKQFTLYLHFRINLN